MNKLPFSIVLRIILAPSGFGFNTQVCYFFF
uniref:Uncharacterized protein n=1 Tax=Rhizophora mucronata TaxID=61149 RepID=A0A2P2Q7D0_RHIMU